MNSFVKASLAIALASVPLMADESFGGIGITIYQVPAGVHVAEVIPGGPASQTNLQAGDVITAVDGVSLKGQNIEFSKDQLRGVVNKPLEITYISGGETYSAVMRRTQMTVKDLDSKKVADWYNKSEFNAQELETFASATESNKQLLAVLQRGSLVSADQSVNASNLNGVYIDKVNEFAPKPVQNKAPKASTALLLNFDRKTIGFNLKEAGTAVVKVMDANGEQIAELRLDNALAGANSVSWDASNVPNGRYMVQINHNGAVSATQAILK
ncbi:MAG: PDZ domain-containing protein [Fibrobacteraceae bacterium]|nr:PDZ domain-containing protein [Fibrobacteraceae bacterium]